MEIGAVLTRAWQIIWKHKVLWIFGILAGCTNGGGSSSSRSSSQGDSGEIPSQIQSLFEEIPSDQIMLITLGIILAIVILVAIKAFLGAIGRIGLIRGANQVDKGAETLAFGELFSESMPYFWRVFLLNLAIGLVFGLVFAAVLLVGILGFAAAMDSSLVCLIPLICILVPVALVINVLIEQANNAIVIEDLGMMDGLRRGWQVMSNNVGTMTVMWLILELCISGIGGLIIVSPLLLVAIPAIIGSSAGTDQALTGGLATAAACFCAYLPVLLVVNGILISYAKTSWTLTFTRLTAKPSIDLQSEPLR